MHPEIKVIWLEALRSGLYKQGKSLLKCENTQGELEYCCLGVLSDIAVKHGVVSVSRDVILNQDGSRGYTFGDNSRAALPPEVAEWSGVDGVFGDLSFPYDGVYSDLAGMNDAGKPFDLIADVIEDYL